VARRKWETYNILEEFVLWIALLAFVATVAQNLLDFILLRILRHGISVVVPGMSVSLEGFEVFNVVDIIRDLYAPGGHPNFITRTNSLLLLGSRAIIRVRVGFCRWARWTYDNWGS
jgi:hypothetical protein